MEKIKKIKPFLQAQLFILKRKAYEFFGNEKFSKPYYGHDELLKYIDKKNGFFIVGGGNDGYFQDPTYYLERFRGWTGIIIEPTRIKKYCRVNRPQSVIFDVALVSHDFSGTNLTLVDCNTMTIVKDGVAGYQDWVSAGEQAQKIIAHEITVLALTLDALLAKYFARYPKRQIDLVTLDLEGYELEALKGLDLQKYQPEFLLIEIHRPERKEAIDSYLGNRYRLVTVIEATDYLYQKNTHV